MPRAHFQRVDSPWWNLSLLNRVIRFAFFFWFPRLPAGRPAPAARVPALRWPAHSPPSARAGPGWYELPAASKKTGVKKFPSAKAQPLGISLLLPCLGYLRQAPNFLAKPASPYIIDGQQLQIERLSSRTRYSFAIVRFWECFRLFGPGFMCCACLPPLLNPDPQLLLLLSQIGWSWWCRILASQP